MSNHQVNGGKVAAYTDFVIQHRWWVVVASTLATVALVLGLMRIGFDNDYRVFFSDDNPHLQAFERLQQTYTKNDNVVFAITPKDGEVFSREVLSAVEEVTEAARAFPYALRVDSVTNFQYSRSEGDDLIVEDLVENAMSFSDEQLQEVKAIALKEPFIVGQLLNESASVTAVNTVFQMPQVDLNEVPDIVSEVRALKDRIESNYPVQVHLSGVVMLSNAFFESSMSDFQTLIPAMYLIIIVTMMLLLRSFLASLATVVVIFFSVLAAMGAAGWMGIKLTPPSTSAATIIMTLAVADSIHILTSLFIGMRKGMSRHDAIRYSMRLNFAPVLLTSITTAIGFLSMNTSDAPPFHDLGNITAIGVMWAFVMSVTLLPALVAILPLKASQKENQFGIWMTNLSEYVIQKRKAVLAVTAVGSLLFVAAIPLNTFDDNYIGYFDHSVQFRVDADYINDNLTGVYQIQYSLDTGEDYGVSDPAFLQKVDDFVAWFRAQPNVKHVNSFTDTIKRINKNMHEDDPAYYRLPEKKDLSAQYVLLYELSLPEGMDLNNQMDIGKSSTQVVVTLDDMPSSEIAIMADKGREWLLKEQNIDTYGVGPAVMFAHISESNMKNMLVGAGLAIVLISILITISLRNIRIGALSLIPNLLPIAGAFGVWALINGEVNVAVSMVTGMALGIVVDDSVHFLSKYLRARREEHLNREDAVRYAFSSVGVAIIVTSIILVAGFVVLGQSSFGMNSSMAVLTAIAIAMALLADFLLLPALLMKLDKKNYATGPKETLQDDNEQKIKTEGEHYA